MMSVPKQQFKTPQLPINTPGSPARGISLFSAAEDHDHGVSPGITGAGVVNRLAFWTGTSTLDDVPRTLTPGSVLFAGSDFLPQEDNAKLFFDDTLNRLGVGTISLDKALHVASTPPSNDDGVLVDTFGNLGFPSFTTRNSNGTQATPTAILSGNSLGNFQFGGRKATSFTNLAAAVNADATENWTDSATGTNLRFFTTATGTTTLAEKFRVGPSGQWGIGGANYGTAGQYKRSAGVAAAPTWATIPLSEISPRDHSTLTSLVAPADDHTQYALLAGRSGGQTLIGSTVTNEGLIFRTNSSGVGTTDKFGFASANVGAFTPDTFFHIKSGGANIKLQQTTDSGGPAKAILIGTGIIGPDGAGGFAMQSNNDCAFGAYNREGMRLTGSAASLNIVIGAEDTNNSAAPGSGRSGLILVDGTALGSMASFTAGFYADSVGTPVRMFTIDSDNSKTELQYADKWGHSLMLGGM